jgi:hypothetical protein
LHARVLARRERVLDACSAAQRAIHRLELPLRTIAVASAVVVTGFEARRRQKQAQRESAAEAVRREVSVRVPVSLATDRG